LCFYHECIQKTKKTRETIDQARSRIRRGRQLWWSRPRGTQKTEDGEEGEEGWLLRRWLQRKGRANWSRKERRRREGRRGRSWGWIESIQRRRTSYQGVEEQIESPHDYSEKSGGPVQEAARRSNQSDTTFQTRNQSRKKERERTDRWTVLREIV